MYKSLIITLLFLNNSIAQNSSCNCENENIDHHPRADYSMGNSDHWQDTLAKWVKSNDVGTVKVLEIGHFGKMPKEFKMFVNVETLVIGSTEATIKNLNVFPKLNTLIIQESGVTFKKKNELKAIKYLIARKARISGVKTFSNMPELIYVHMSYSGFEEFPKDFDKLDKLCTYITGASTDGTINLDDLDLGLNK